MDQTKPNKTAYYNEIDPYAAQWLRNLIQAGHIAHGIVDDRSIEDVTPGDLRGFTQCHFFAGIGVWSYALRRAGWPDTREVWTGSAPCQPFSAAGKGAGFTDERHLWPAFFHLIEKCRPPIVLGEQVASKDAGHWIDLVHADVESVGYAFGAVPFPAASVGAPHIRDRLYWVADATDQRLHGWRTGKTSDGRDAAWFQPERLCDVGRLDNSRQNHDAAQGQAASDGQSKADRSADQFGGSGLPLGGVGDSNGKRAWRDGRTVRGEIACIDREHLADDAGASSCTGWMGVTNGNGCEQGRSATEAMGHGNSADAAGGTGGMAHSFMQQRPDGQPGIGDVDDASGRNQGATAPAGLRCDLRPGPTNGFWRDADWLLCRDGKWRPVEPGTFPLAHGVARDVGRVRADQERLTALLPRKDQGSRVGRLRGYGNAICAEAARVFIESVMEAA